MKIENVTITKRIKITKQVITKFNNEQVALNKQYGITPPKNTKNKAEKKKELERFNAEIEENQSATIEYMALVAACFLIYEREGIALTMDEIDKFLDEEVDFDDMSEIGDLGLEAFLEYQKKKANKKKSTDNSKKD